MHTIFWHDNILFRHNGVAYGVYRLPELPYENQPVSIQRSIYRQLEVIFQSYRGEVQLLNIGMPLLINGHNQIKLPPRIIDGGWSLNFQIGLSG